MSVRVMVMDFLLFKRYNRACFKARQLFLLYQLLTFKILTAELELLPLIPLTIRRSKYDFVASMCCQNRSLSLSLRFNVCYHPLLYNFYFDLYCLRGQLYNLQCSISVWQSILNNKFSTRQQCSRCLNFSRTLGLSFRKIGTLIINQHKYLSKNVTDLPWLIDT